MQSEVLLWWPLIHCYHIRWWTYTSCINERFHSDLLYIHLCFFWETITIVILFHSVKRSNCYMVCAGEATGLSRSRRSAGLEIGCLIDTATGRLTFTSSGMEMATFYQVSHTGNGLTCFISSLFWYLFTINYIKITLNILNLIQPCMAHVEWYLNNHSEYLFTMSHHRY